MASLVTSVAATVIAALALWISYSQARATRLHNRKLVRPVLQMGARFHVSDTAGLVLSNVGIGPAVITDSWVELDGTRVGRFGKAAMDQVRDTLTEWRPSAATFTTGSILEVGYREFLLRVPDYDSRAHAEFAELLTTRLRLGFRYESLYGDETWELVWPEA
ncbi:hypothetical protein Lesp02_72490 [Lentzea sp. NBRC 105346]|uniref:hypothetical protein n=1 Tax=Lentzea sp. NBRC 105346 TaxID=3032205 RepID=UPI0024A54FEB|nr:hypothetical protein [Lentzea sp. NBRC 105346]GLZ35062.1 hypothetical protein Lesp02_72490 [Lentzea sp. NBRC 105346]